MRNIKNEIKLIKWIILLPILGVLVTSLILTYIFISSKYNTLETEIASLEKDYPIELKDKIKQRIEHLSILINTNYNNQIENSKNVLKNLINMGHKNLEEIYNSNDLIKKEEIHKIIDERMKRIRFFENQSGYFFIWDLESAKSISLPSAPNLVGSSLVNLTDKKGKNLFISYGNILKEKGEGFDSWYWKKPNQNEMLQKIGYIKKFEPLNIGIGTAVYLEDVKETIKKESLEFISKLQYSDNSYIFIIRGDGTTLLHKNKAIENKPLSSFDKVLQENVNNIINKAKSSDGTFLEYVQSKNFFKNFTPSKKISFIKYIPKLDWVIGTGLYTDDLNEQILNKRKSLEDDMINAIFKIIIVSLVVSLLIIVVLWFISKKIRNLILNYSQELNKKNKELKKLNHDLEETVKKQVNSIREKDLTLNQHSKLAAMGEMLGNVAHQWRQPLSSISILASGIRLNKDLGMLTDENMDKDLKNIINTTKVLSNTIDDFRDFYSNKKELSSFKIQDVINQVVSLVGGNLTNKDIKLIYNIDDIEIESYRNDLIQVLLNVINNAKDALIDQDLKIKIIKISAYKKGEFVEIEIYDNAKGINEEIIHRIFEPYFTTKFKSQGTGIGLYMTKKIIESSLNGKISVSNKFDNCDDEEHCGASFNISLPLSVY